VRIESLTMAALVIAACAVPARATTDDEAPQWAERSDAVAAPQGLAGIDIDNPRGTVVLRPSADGRIHVTAIKICRLPGADQARRYAAQTRVHAGIEAGRYRVRVEYPPRIDAHLSLWNVFSERGRRQFGRPAIEVRLTVDVPARLPVQTTTVSGDVTSDDLPGAQTVSSTSGDVVARGASGAVSVRTVSGDVSLEGPARAEVHTSSGDVGAAGASALAATTSSGDIEVRDARGALDLRSESGDVSVGQAPAGLTASSSSGEVLVRGASGRVHVTTQSGDVRVWLKGPLSGAELSSASGDVWAELAGGMGATLEAESTSGAIDCRGAFQVIDHGPNHLRARVGAGGAAIRMNTVSGGLTVTSGGM